jgi:putative transposase
MNYKLDKGGHSVYALQYHLVQCVKYRRKILIGEPIIQFLKDKTHEISDTFQVNVLNMECDKDHFHMIFTAKPTLDIPKYLNIVKTITSREIQRKFPEVKKSLWNGKFWSRSYFLATSGQVTLDQLKKYVEKQGEKNVD